MAAATPRLPNPRPSRSASRPPATSILHQGAVDIGQGSNTVITQICADALGLPLEKFRLKSADTAITPGRRQDIGLAPDLRHRQGGRKGRPRLAREDPALCQCLGERGDCPRWAGLIASARARLPAASISPPSIVDADGFVFRAEETYDPPTLPLDAKGQGKPYAVYGYGAQIAELEVDLKLGTVKLIKITAAHDVGKAINPLLVEGQIEGGIAQGIGMALMEEYIPGRTENLHDYLIPTIGDVPPIETILVEVPDPEGPFGAKGLGEHVLIPTAPAILNAIRHATGVLVTKVPATPTRIRAAIREKEARR